MNNISKTTWKYIYLDTCVLFDIFHLAFKDVHPKYIEENGRKVFTGPPIDLMAIMTKRLLLDKYKIVHSNLCILELFNLLRANSDYPVFHGSTTTYKDKISLISGILDLPSKRLPDEIFSWDEFTEFMTFSPVIYDKQGRKKSIQDYIHLYYCYKIKFHDGPIYFVTSDEGILESRKAFEESPLKFNRIISKEHCIQYVRDVTCPQESR